MDPVLGKNIVKNKIVIPPLKYQGIKTKLIPFIQENVQLDENSIWIEPFMGSGVVGFNMPAKKHVMCDKNPHVINFYISMIEKCYTPEYVKQYLHIQGKGLVSQGEEYYYFVRDKIFNEHQDPLELLFLSRTCFNGLMRFNKKGKYNVPFCRNVNRLTDKHIDMVVSRYKDLYDMFDDSWTFRYDDYATTIKNNDSEDAVFYCDPPYIGLDTNYVDSWGEVDELKLFNLLDNIKGKFILSTWLTAKDKKNEYIDNLWSKFNIVTTDHYYSVGPKAENRYKAVELLVKNF